MAGRYATALVDLANESKSLDTVAGELKRIKDLLDGSPDLKRLVRSPVYSREEQGGAMDAILGRLNVSTLTKNFVGLVAQKRRLFALRDIITAFEKIVAAQRGELSADRHERAGAQARAADGALRHAQGHLQARRSACRRKSIRR